VSLALGFKAYASMAQQSFAGLAVLIALAFAIMALNACANSEHRAESFGPAIIAPLESEVATPEFHGAEIGPDTLLSRLPSES
jgi:hypothetical protein